MEMNGDATLMKRATSHAIDSQVSQEWSYWRHVWRQFRKNKLGMWSFGFIILLAVVALLADFIANEKPLLCKVNGRVYSPVIEGILRNFGLQKRELAEGNVNWRELDYQWAVWPPVPYLPQNLDFVNARKGPFDEQVVPSWRWRHWLGTDELGRDVLAGMIHASRIALSVGVVAMAIASVIGILLGSVAGFLGDEKVVSRVGTLVGVVLGVFFGIFYGFGVRGFELMQALGRSFGDFIIQLCISLAIVAGIVWLGVFVGRSVLSRVPFLGWRVRVAFDILISRLIEVVVTIPTLFLIVSIVAIAKPSVFLVMVVIGLTSWTGIARFVRAELLRVRSLEYMEATEALGYSLWRALVRHALPNSLTPVLIAVAFGIASAVLIESTLSFLGLGVPADTVTWGSLLALSRKYPEDWWLAVFPGFAIFITVTAFNLVGEALIDAMDPRLRR